MPLTSRLTDGAAVRVTRIGTAEVVSKVAGRRPHRAPQRLLAVRGHTRSSRPAATASTAARRVRDRRRQAQGRPEDLRRARCATPAPRSSRSAPRTGRHPSPGAAPAPRGRTRRLALGAGPRRALRPRRVRRPRPSSGGGLDWAALARCESGGNPRAVSSNGLYYGLYQFSIGTWQSVGGSGRPSDASSSEQTARAQTLYRAPAARRGPSAAGTCSCWYAGSCDPEPATSEPAPSPLLTAPDVRRLAARLGTRPTKALGQNFVIDPNTVRRIVRTAGVRPDDVVVEVGPGLGSLTLELLVQAGPGRRGRDRPGARGRAAGHGGAAAARPRRPARGGAAGRPARSPRCPARRRRRSWPTCRTTWRCRCCSGCSSTCRRCAPGW